MPAVCRCVHKVSLFPRFSLQVQSGYYSEQEARLGFFPSSVVEETQLLQPGDVEVMTEVSAAFLHPIRLKSLQNKHTHTPLFQ